MSILKPFRRAVLACVALLAVSSIAKATTFNSFGPVVGPTVTYSGGERDTWTTDPVAPSATWLFGTPIVGPSSSANFTSNFALTPKPLNFSVVAPGTEQFEDGTLAVNISATNPQTGSIALLSVQENGDYFFQNATAASSAKAALNIAGLLITQVDNGAVDLGPFGGQIGVSFNEFFSNVSGSGVPVVTANSIT